MAREMYLVGVTPEELQPDPPPEGPKTPKEKWDNFWYHYKWWVAAAVFAAVVVGVFVWQMVTTVHPDYTVALVTKDTVSEETLAQLETELQAHAADLNGDGDVTVEVENLVLGQFVGGNQNGMSETYNTKLVAYLMTGDVMFYVFDDTCYRMRIETLVAEEGSFFEALPADLTGVDPETNYWNWKGSPYQQSSWGKDLPEDLYFGVRRMGGSAAGVDAQKQHDDGMTLLEAFIRNEETTE